MRGANSPSQALAEYLEHDIASRDQFCRENSRPEDELKSACRADDRRQKALRILKKMSEKLAEGNRVALPRAELSRLVRRLIDSTRAPRLSLDDRVWVVSLLTRAELELWARLGSHDKIHAVRVAKATRSKLAGTAYENDGRWLGAALMHDIGKVEANLAMHERAVATLAGRAVRLSRAMRWATGSLGFIRRLGLYLTHGAVGAEMIKRAGGRPELAAWAEVHQAYDLPSKSVLPELVLQTLSVADAE